MQVVGLLTAVLASLAFGIGSVAQAAGVRRGGAGTGVTRLLRNRLFLLGLAFDGLGFAASLVALHVLPLFEAQSVLATSLAVTVLLAWPLLHVRTRPRDLAAVVVAGLACAVTAAAAGQQATVAPPRGFVLAAVLAAAALVLAGSALARRRAAPWLLALAAGLAQSVQVLSTRGLDLTGVSPRHPLAAAATVGGEPLAWSLAVSGITGVLLYGLALERGGVGAATAILWVVEIVVPTVVGLSVLGDTVQPGWAPALAVALAAAVAATLALARSPGQVA